MDESVAMHVDDPTAPHDGEDLRHLAVVGGSFVHSSGDVLSQSFSKEMRKHHDGVRGAPLQAWGPPHIEPNVVNVGLRGGGVHRGPEEVPYLDHVGSNARPTQNTQSQVPIKLSRLGQSEQAATRVAVRLGKIEAWKTQLNEMKVIHDQCTLKQRAYYKKQLQTTRIYHLNAFITLLLIITSGAIALASDSFDEHFGEGKAGTTGAVCAFVAALCFYLDKYLQWAQMMERHSTAAARAVALLSDLENAILNFCSRIALISVSDGGNVDEEFNLAARDCDRYRGALKAIELEYPLTFDGSYLPDEV